MTERIRLVVDTEDVIRRAVGLRRLRLAGNPTASDVVNEILRAALADEIAEIEKHMPAQQGEKPAKRKRGRPKGKKDGGAEGE